MRGYSFCRFDFSNWTYGTYEFMCITLFSGYNGQETKIFMHCKDKRRTNTLLNITVLNLHHNGAPDSWRSVWNMISLTGRQSVWSKTCWPALIWEIWDLLTGHYIRGQNPASAITSTNETRGRSYNLFKYLKGYTSVQN